MDDHLVTAISDLQSCIEARDRAGAERLLDEEYRLVLVAPSRAVMPRDRWLDVLPDYIVHEYVIEEQIVDHTDDLAAVLQRVRMRATVLGEERSGVFVLSDVWRKRHGEWRVWRRHSTPLSAGSMPST